MRVGTTDFVLGIGAIVLSAGYLYVASGIPESMLSDAVGAAGVPKVLGWAMGILGALLCLRSVRFGRPAETTRAKASAEADEAPKGMRPHVLALGLLGILVAYILVAPYLGYAASMGLLVAAGARYCGAPFNRNLVLISVAAAFGFWFVFVQLLGIPMPGSVLLEGF